MVKLERYEPPLQLHFLRLGKFDGLLNSSLDLIKRLPCRNTFGEVGYVGRVIFFSLFYDDGVACLLQFQISLRSYAAGLTWSCNPSALATFSTVLREVEITKVPF